MWTLHHIANVSVRPGKAISRKIEVPVLKVFSLRPPWGRLLVALYMWKLNLLQKMVLIKSYCMKPCLGICRLTVGAKYRTKIGPDPFPLMENFIQLILATMLRKKTLKILWITEKYMIKNAQLSKLSKALKGVGGKSYLSNFLHFGPRVYPKGSIVIALVRPSVR